MDLELELKGLGTMTLTGRLHASDVRLWSVEVEAGGEHRSVHTDADGGFGLEGLPQGSLTLRLRGEAENFHMTIEP